MYDNVMASIKLIRASDGSGNASVATVQSARSGGATTIVVDTVSGINDHFCGTMGTPHTFTDPVTSETITVISEATAVDFVGHVDGSNLEIDTIALGYVDSGSEVGDIVIIRPTTQWGDNVADVLDVEHNDDGTHSDVTADSLAIGGVDISSVATNAPQGYMINGKLSVSVASNNLTVAVKTLAGTDPSATDPVHVRIGNTVRSITSALSVTKNAGTNWFGMGSGYWAALDTDYFAYIGYNATDGVVLGFAKIPNARVYGDFSTTSTEYEYCAISTITNATSTDEYEVVGRFNATLSAGAGYTWSIPATAIVINRPIYETRTYSATNTGSGGGTIYWKHVGSVRSARGRTSQYTGLSPGTATDKVITFPADFFMTAPVVVGNLDQLGTTGKQGFYQSVTASTTSATLTAFNLDSAGSASGFMVYQAESRD